MSYVRDYQEAQFDYEKKFKLGAPHTIELSDEDAVMELTKQMKKAIRKNKPLPEIEDYLT